MGDGKYNSYDDLVRSLGAAQRNDMTGHRRRAKPGDDDEIEMFVTSEDKAKEAKLREAGDPRDRKRGGQQARPEESVYFRYADKSRVQKYTDDELTSFREGCRRVIVHDYSEHDFYHLGDEERIRNDQLAKINFRLGGLKRIYRSVDQYIVAMRIVYEAWSILADKNPIHTRDEFFDYVARGIIVSSRIIVPKLKGIDNFNRDMILTYISNPSLDPKDLLPKPAEDPDDYLYIDADERKFEMDCLLSPSEIQHVIEYETRPIEDHDQIPVRDIKRKFLKAYDSDQSLRRKKHQKGKLNKVDRNLQPDMSAILKKLMKANARRDIYSSGYSFSSLADTFDRSRQETIWDRFPYQDSWQDDDRVGLYELAINNEHLSELIPGDGALTYADKAINAFYAKLEANGISTVEMRRTGQNSGTYLEEKKKHSRKQNRKIETAVLNRIGRLSENTEFKKLIKKSEKSLEQYRTEQQEDTD